MDVSFVWQNEEGSGYLPMNRANNPKTATIAIFAIT
jgi:hypothetical protein